MDTPYDGIFDGILVFRHFADVERTLRRLEQLRRHYLAARDEKGLRYCREIALVGRRRAESISRNRKVSPGKRMHKREVALWFQIWLETPDIFADWLALRKKTEQFRRLEQAESANSERRRRRNYGI